MSNLVIVAIPEENDRVWKVSSEKIPHLTLLALGDPEHVSNLEQIMLFVEHAANTSLKRFYLPVDHRGELGVAKADVLFFRKNRYDFKAVRDFRSLLLQDQNIKTAYDAFQQFETPEEVGQPGQPWIPHLTLGYPETPAKSIPDDQNYSFYDVNFNKLAVWPGDFEGPEFLLKDYWEEFDEMDVPMDVAMSDIQHHGVRGMKWGVRGGASAVGSAAKSAGSGVKKAAKTTVRVVRDANFEARATPRSDGGVTKSHKMVAKRAHGAFKKIDLKEINAKPEHVKASKLKNRLLHPKDPGTKAYRKEAKEAYIKRLETSANAFTNASGTRQYTVRDRHIDLPSQGGSLPRSKYFWDVSARDIAHAADDNVVEKLEVIMDADGFIIDLKDASEADTLAQTADLGAAFLEHHGIRGMKWGVRNRDGSTFSQRMTERKDAVEAKNRESRPAKDTTARDTIGSSKRKKTKISTKGGEDHPATEDAINVALSRQKLKKSGVHALSNKELQDVERRLNLEQNVARLTGSKKAFSGKQFVDSIIGNQKNQKKVVDFGFKSLAKKGGKAAAVAAL